MMTEKDLFEEYQSKLEWINRRLQPDALEFFHETAETWKHAKEVAFNMYQHIRGLMGFYPNLEECFDYNNKIKAAYKPYNDNFPCIGILKYRGNTYPIYNDDYGMQDFIVIDDYPITVDSFGGGIDWWYELDRIIDKIYE